MVDEQNAASLENPEINPVEQSLHLAEERKYLDAFITWFQGSPQQRDEAVHQTWMKMAETKNWALRSAMKSSSLSETDLFIARHLALLISLTGQKLFGPLPQEQLTLEEFGGAYEYPIQGKYNVFQRTGRDPENEAHLLANQKRRFDLMVSELNQKWGTNLSVGDPHIANRAIVGLSENTIRINFTAEEMSRFIKQTLPRVKMDAIPDNEKGGYFESAGLVEMPRHQFLSEDPELGKYFPPEPTEPML